MYEAARSILLIWTGALLTLAFLMIRRARMKSKASFDPNESEHVLLLASMIDHIVNTDRGDVRFALVVWQSDRDQVQGLVSNDGDDQTVMGMLDDAKNKVCLAGELIHRTSGHA
jgi:hypothetical protein